MKFYGNKSGLGLIEVIVALAVVITGVVSGLTLTSYNLDASVASQTRLIAANLAREGLEVVRSLRDSNWLAGNPWNSNIVAADKYRLIVQFDPSANAWSTVSQDTDLAACDACQIYLDEANDVYGHDDTKTLTGYRRLLTKRDICWPTGVTEALLAEGEVCGDYGYPLAGWQLESEVSWTEQRQIRTISVIDKIYDWH